ncbi:hypothetical protein C0Q70_12074 [Pomacea canaliculata]|uniref:Neural cell adhesion molecule 1 n=1 Tax=Pomacea canaliculata TaxID=400727 RepID=A0A2T7P0I8_POMCA|nr:hypothetical protein C0Q70_12074 [Pomacea canaliculata]
MDRGASCMIRPACSLLKPVPKDSASTGGMEKSTCSQVLKGETTLIMAIPAPDINNDNGRYTCKGVLQGNNVEASITLQLYKVPVMTGPVTSLPPSPKAGDTVELTCMATGRPTPTYKFYKVEGSNDIPITPESVTNGKLILKDITQETEGKYKCEASNIKGSTSQEFPIDVMIPPKIDPIETLSGTEEARGQLSCSAVGDPQPSVTWKREDQNYYYVEQPSGDDRIYVAIERTQEGEKNERKRTTATLVFKTLQPDDMHNYICEASNTVGTDQATTYVEVKFLPGKPQLTVVDRKSTLLEIAITPPGNDGGQPVKEYIVKYGPPTASDPDLKTMRVDINPADRTNTKVQLRNLEAKTEYRIKVAAHTNVGIGLDADIVDSTLEVSVPGRVDITSDKNGLDGSRYTLTWVTTLTGGADITDYEIKYAKVEVTTDSNTGTWSVVRTPNDYKVVSVPGTSTSHVLENLDKNSYYHVGIVAVNRIGKSEESVFIFKTSLGEVEEDYEEESPESDESEGPVITGPESDIEDVHEAKGEGKMPFRGDTGGPAIGTGGIVGIIVVLLLVLVVIVDVAFCVTKQCGLFWTIRQAVGSKEPGPGTSSKSPEEGDEAAAKLLGKEKEDSLRNENEVAKEAEPAEEAGHDAEEKKELEPEDKEEKPIELNSVKPNLFVHHQSDLFREMKEKGLCRNMPPLSSGGFTDNPKEEGLRSTSVTSGASGFNKFQLFFCVPILGLIVKLFVQLILSFLHPFLQILSATNLQIF